MPSVEQIPDYQKASLADVKDKKWVEAQYKGELSAVDEQLGRLMAWLSDNNKFENTLIVFVGAYGENFGEDEEWFDHGSVLNERRYMCRC